MLAFKYPPPAITTLEPIISFGIRFEKSNIPWLELKIVDAMSGSLASWFIENEMFAVEFALVLLKFTITSGVKPIHSMFPVKPPTQLPQLSRKAVPFGVL